MSAFKFKFTFINRREEAKHTTTAGAAVWSTGIESVAGADIVVDGIYLRGGKLKGIREMIK